MESKLIDNQMALLESRRSELTDIGAGELAAGRVLSARTGEMVVYAGRTAINESVIVLLDGSIWKWNKAGRERFGAEFWDLVDDLMLVVQASRE